MRRTALACATAIALAGGLDVAWAAWSGSGTGSASAKAVSMPAGNTPSGSATEHDVQVTWTASSFSGGATITDYVVKRYDLSNNLQTIGSACSGTVSATTCTEHHVPSGSWKYSVTPRWASWTGAESAKSSTVVVTPIARSLTTSAYTVSDASSGTASDVSSRPAFADGLLLTNSSWSSSFSSTRYVDFDMSAALPAGEGVDNPVFNLSFASTGSSTTCVYFEVKRLSTGAVIGTHGSAASPLRCVTGTTQVSSSTAIPEVTTSTIADDLRIRVYGNNTASSASAEDVATVSGDTDVAFTLYPASVTDRANGSASTTPWPWDALDGSAYTSAAGWDTSFNTSKYLQVSFPAYVPAGATGIAATFKHAYHSNTLLANTCVYLEVYSGGTLIGSHGSSGSPLSCNSASSFATDTVSLSEVNTVARANGVVVKLYFKTTGLLASLRLTQHDLATLTIDYND